MNGLDDRHRPIITEKADSRLQVKDELQSAMGLDTDPLGGTWDFLRRGYKVPTPP